MHGTVIAVHQIGQSQGDGAGAQAAENNVFPSSQLLQQLFDGSRGGGLDVNTTAYENNVAFEQLFFADGVFKT